MHHKYPFITGRVTIQHFHERRIDKYLPIINPPRIEKRREGKPQIVPKNEQSEIKEKVYYISHKNSSNRVGKKKKNKSHKRHCLFTGMPDDSHGRTIPGSITFYCLSVIITV